MGVIGAVGGWAIYHLVSRVFKGLFGCILAAAFAAWCSIVLAAVACAGELAASGAAAWSVALPAMAGVHMLIGIGEGLISGLVLVGIARARPELLRADEAGTAARSYGSIVAYGAIISLAVALFASPFASAWPDGLEKVAEHLGFAGERRRRWWRPRSRITRCRACRGQRRQRRSPGRSGRWWCSCWRGCWRGCWCLGRPRRRWLWGRIVSRHAG